MSGFSRNQFKAGECTHEEYLRCMYCPDEGYGPVVQSHVWEEIFGGESPPGSSNDYYLPKELDDLRPKVFVCQSCMERQLGRKLAQEDLQPCGLTDLKYKP